MTVRTEARQDPKLPGGTKVALFSGTIYDENDGQIMIRTDWCENFEYLNTEISRRKGMTRSNKLWYAKSIKRCITNNRMMEYTYFAEPRTRCQLSIFFRSDVK